MIFLICNLFFGGIRDIAVVEAAFLYDIRFCVRLLTYLGLFYRRNLQIHGPRKYRVGGLKKKTPPLHGGSGPGPSRVQGRTVYLVDWQQVATRKTMDVASGEILENVCTQGIPFTAGAAGVFVSNSFGPVS